LNIGDYVKQIVLEDSNGKTQDLLVDSRTFLYSDLVNSLKTPSLLIWGLGGSAKIKTSLLEDENASFDRVYKEGRRDSETAITSLFQYGGLVAVFLYFLLMLKASYLALYKSNSWLSKMFGVWLSFKFASSFIAEPFTYTVSNVFFYLFIGLCFNKKFREMSDADLSKILNKY